MPGIKIKETEPIVSGPPANIPSSSDRKGKKVLEEEIEVYTRNIRAQKPDVPFVNLSPTNMAARFKNASRCLLSKSNMEYLDSTDPTEKVQQAHTTMAEVNLCHIHFCCRLSGVLTVV